MSMISPAGITSSFMSCLSQFGSKSIDVRKIVKVVLDCFRRSHAINSCSVFSSSVISLC